MLEIRNLHCQLSGHTILSNIDFSIGEGESFCLFGKNGSGKTTLLKCIAGIYTFDGGIKLCNVEQDDRENYFKSFGFFFSDGLYNFLTVKENFTVFLSYYGIKRKGIAAHIDEYINAFELDGLLNARAKDLSAGQKQRVGLALVFMHKPRLLLFDEPLNNLDVYFIEKFYNVLRKYLLTNKAATLMVNHDVLKTPTWFGRIGLIEAQQLQVAENNPQHLNYFITKLYQK